MLYWSQVQYSTLQKTLIEASSLNSFFQMQSYTLRWTSLSVPSWVFSASQTITIVFQRTWIYTHELYPILPKKGGTVHLNSGTIHSKSQNWTIIDDVLEELVKLCIYDFSLIFLTMWLMHCKQRELYLISTRLQQKLTPVFFWIFTLHLWQIDRKIHNTKHKSGKSTNQANTLLCINTFIQQWLTEFFKSDSKDVYKVYWFQMDYVYIHYI